MDSRYLYKMDYHICINDFVIPALFEEKAGIM